MSHTLVNSARSACLKTTASASIPGGMNYDIAKGSAVSNPVCNFYEDTTLLLSILLDPSEPVSDPVDGVASLQRPGPTAWSSYSQNAAASGTCNNFKVLDRDEATVLSGTCGDSSSEADYVFANGVNWTAGAPIVTTGYVITQPATPA